MKARGWTPALFHIRNKNPFNLEVLVDAWPEYQTVVIRPQKEIVIRDARTQCRLQWPPGASQQQGADRRLGAQRALRPGASVGSGAMARRGDIFYQCSVLTGTPNQNQFEDDREKASPLCRQLRALVTPPNGKCEVTLKLTGSWKLFLLEKGENCFEIFLLHQPLLPTEDVMLILQMRKRSLRKETFQNIFLNVLHARLVNEHWELGKNEKSLKYVECCLQNFEGFGVLSSEGKSISWFLTEQSCEIRMGYTFPKYRGQGHMRQMGCHSIAFFFFKKKKKNTVLYPCGKR
ncbi:glycine N-acyltransferase-like protein [Bos javanicus]|uniref:glycine N-acyltransferase-like protein n=1 Tax=Bos javanicus TaxID=9906 RepID=UPI002AA919F6|nr:glycine N-acyltransferase-like protein [Bos javanicus]